MSDFSATSITVVLDVLVRAVKKKKKKRHSDEITCSELFTCKVMSSVNVTYVRKVPFRI